MQQIGGVVFLDLQVGVARHPERVAFGDLQAGKQRLQIGGDDLLQPDKAGGGQGAVAGAGDKARQDAGNFHAGEPLAKLRVAHDDREIEAEVGNVRERMPRPQRQRRQHREHVALEIAF